MAAELFFLCLQEFQYFQEDNEILSYIYFNIAEKSVEENCYNEIFSANFSEKTSYKEETVMVQSNIKV